MKTAIAFISEHASPLAVLGSTDNGGQNVYVGQLARNLVLQNHTVDIYTRWENAELPEVINWMPNIRVIHVAAGEKHYISKEKMMPLMDGFSAAMLDFIRQNKLRYHLVHAHFWMSGMVAMALKNKLGLPFVITFHALDKVRRMYQGDNDQFPKERFVIEKNICRTADKIIAECPQDEHDLLHYYGADPKKIVAIPCGVNTDEFYPVDKSLSRILTQTNRNEYLVLHLGRMVPRKGIMNVIRAVQQLPESDKPVHLLIIGGRSDFAFDEEVQRFKEAAAASPAHVRISFIGPKQQSELKYYYSAADVFVTTPWYEPFGITPLEAMACGTPVIGSRVGGVQYTVIDQVTGFLVPAEQPAELAERIMKVLCSKKIQAKMSHNAYTRVRSKFTWPIVASSISKIYKRVASHTPEPTADMLVHSAFDQSLEVLLRSKDRLSDTITQVARILSDCFLSNGKVLICGNGGSAAESQHFAAELLGRFVLKNRPALPVLSLTADTSFLTAWANDAGYEHVFERQVEAFGQPGDVFLCLSTSGESPNIYNALMKAKGMRLQTIALLGRSGGVVRDDADLSIVIPSDDTQRIQEMHLHVIHTLCSLVEKQLFDGQSTHTAKRPQEVLAPEK